METGKRPDIAVGAPALNKRAGMASPMNRRPASNLSIERFIAIFLVFVLLAPACARPAAEIDPGWLVSADDLNRLPEDISIIEWELAEEIPGEFRICRVFTGISWSISPNVSQNCVRSVYPGSTFEDVIESMFDMGVLTPTDIKLTPSLDYGHEVALYTYRAENGHSLYEVLLVHDGFLFRASVSLGMPVGYTPEGLFDQIGDVIEGFLYDMLMINLERVTATGR